MSAQATALTRRADIDAYVAGMRQRGWHIEPVSWCGQPAWLKLSVPQSPAWRYQLLAAAARLLCQPAMQAVRPPGGDEGVQLEIRRIQTLSAAGLRVSSVLDAAGDWVLLSDLGQTTLESLLRQTASADRATPWQLGADYLLQTHQAGHYLSQAFARNFVWSQAQGLGAIDFEDDALSVMPLADAQARDWLAYLFSTATHFDGHLPKLKTHVETAMNQETADVRVRVFAALRMTAWLRLLRALPLRMQRRDVVKTRCFGELAQLCGRLG
ncbi:MAG: hypothetical protein ABL877_09505 [Thiobacillus sp.]